jgi:hypothetical protein
MQNLITLVGLATAANAASLVSRSETQVSALAGVLANVESATFIEENKRSGNEDDDLD